MVTALANVEGNPGLHTVSYSSIMAGKARGVQAAGHLGNEEVFGHRTRSLSERQRVPGSHRSPGAGPRRGLAAATHRGALLGIHSEDLWSLAPVRGAAIAVFIGG